MRIVCAVKPCRRRLYIAKALREETICNSPVHPVSLRLVPFDVAIREAL